MYLFFFFNDTATTEIYTLSLHDALPIYQTPQRTRFRLLRTLRYAAQLSVTIEHNTCAITVSPPGPPGAGARDRKSTRLNSSHANISYAVFCLKKKKTNNKSSRTYLHSPK